MWLTIIALIAQLSDATLACNRLNTGNYYEANPILGDTCKSVLIRKSLIVAPLLIWNNKYAKISLITSGTLGVTLTLALDNGNK